MQHGGILLKCKHVFHESEGLVCNMCWCGQCDHGRTQPSFRSKGTQVCSHTVHRLPDCKVRTYTRGEILVRHHDYLNSEDIGNLPLEPFQPKHIAFPSWSFGKSAPVNPSFQAMWFK